MKIEPRNISIRDLCEGYDNRNEDGVFGYGGALDIRPPYQREFVYKDAQRNAVIDTVRKGFPLNVMYWAKTPDGRFEVMDGQQRTISICEYVAGKFSISAVYFHTLPKDQQEQILDYELLVYVCEGEPSERLAWFEIINIAGEELTPQELRNASYTGPWLTDAKRYFSMTNCAAFRLGKDLLTGVPIRQDYLETVLRWISKGDIKQYMADHQPEQNARELWLYFQNLVAWVESIFGKNIRKEMKGVEWGPLYDRFKADAFDPKAIEAEVARLMQDEDVTRKSGIYPFIFTREQKHLNLRTFTDRQKREAYERQKGVCPACSHEGEAKVYALSDMDADHITPWSEGGRTDAENCQMLCKRHNRSKGNR